MSNQHEFLRQTALYNALGAAFQRVQIYTDEVAEAKKEKFKHELADHLRNMEQQYRLPVSSEKHCRNIERLAFELSGSHKKILKGGHFRVGVAQKAINIYLKLIWCYGWIPEPPHCPLDSIVLKEIGDTTTKWTKMNSIEEYKRAIQRVRSHIRQKRIGQSLSEWELDIWNNR